MTSFRNLSGQSPIEVINYAKELNASQLQAVQSTEGPHLVIAGAGSGKTRVLVYRVAYLLHQGTLPEQILLLTFTRKAAQEMLERASRLVDDRCHNVSGGTFHSFANRVLRRHAPLLGLSKSFTILDQNDSEATIKIVQGHLGMGKADKKFPKKNTILNILSQSVNKGQDLDAVVYAEYPQFFEWMPSLQRLQYEYKAYKKSMSLLDYDDLLIYLRDLLEQHTSVQKELSLQYRYIMVDEYQDTNHLQARIVRLLAAEHSNVMAVGDDAQSIYSFRGADFRNIMDFPKLFPGAKVIKLEENYRSAQPILDLSNEVIKGAQEKFDKELFSNVPGKRKPVLVDVANENSQSKFVVNQVLDLIDHGVPLNEIAILFRSGWHSNDLEIELASQGIPFVKYGGQKFIEAAHIKDMICLLRLAHNPVDELSWQRVLLLMPGIGPKAAEKIYQEVKQAYLGHGTIDPKLITKYKALGTLLESLQQVQGDACAPVDVIKTLLKHYHPMLVDNYDDYDKRLSDLDSLERIAQRYENLEELLTDLALDPPEKDFAESYRKLPTGNHLILSTIHSAKGLEWHSVFILFMAEGYLPSYRSFESEAALEEERRLFYVAATRAKKSLFLLKPRVDTSPRAQWDAGMSMYTRVSRFLEEGMILRRLVDIESTCFEEDRSGW